MDQTREVPELATCSYAGFKADMGMPVRITLGINTRVKLPDPRFYPTRQRWLYMRELAPEKDYFKAEAAEFDRRYLAQLARFAKQIEYKLSWLPVRNDRLVLLCFERRVRGPQDCHRRLFAEWWQERTGREVPELDGPVVRKTRPVTPAEEAENLW